MSLQRLIVSGKPVRERVRKAQRRHEHNQRAWRFGQYTGPLAALLAAVAALAALAGRLFR